MDITVQQVELLSDDDYIYLDVRGEIAYQHGHIPKAYEWAGDFSHIEELPKDKRLIVYCNYGEKSAPIAEQLRQEGYEALNLSGGYREWLLHVTSQKEQMQDVSKDGLHLFSSTEELTPDEVKRYDRQIILPQVGSDGQKKLKKSKVLIIGAGGLGAPAALYLAGAGVGTIGIVDADDVSVSNLQRQIIHTSKREGTNKAESAKKSMLELNENIKVNTYPEYLYADNAEELFKEYDFIIDAVDNFETKFLINDTCVLLKKPFCHAGILQFQGQVMTYVPEEDQPCYRCIFEEIPESGSVPNCSQAGIIGAVAGIIGCIQALEAIKYLLGIGELLTGKMLVMDGLTMNTRVVKFPSKNKNCRVCGENADITSVRENRMEYVGAACPGEIKDKERSIMTLKNMIELADGLTPIETEIGYYILKNQEDILDMSVVELAEKTFVSKSAIHRFCKKIGLKGFNELKVILAKDISEMKSDIEMIDVNYPFERKDGPQMIAKKLSKLYETAIYDTYDYMDFIELHKVAQLLHKAEVIDIYTHSHNMNVAENFQDKMLTAGKSSVECPHGFYKQRLTALASNEKHAAIILSYSGKATFVKPILKVLYQKKVPVVYVGKVGGNLYPQYVTCALTISSKENLRDRISQFSSHIAMQYMMDVVFGCIYNMDREKNIEYLKESIGFMDDRDI